MADSRVSHSSILAAIRKQIVDGELRSGDRLPTRRLLHDRFGASPITIQRAMKRLMAEGFVVARGRLGTFVAARPPHLSRYALVFPGPLASPYSWWQLLARQAKQIVKNRPISIVPYQQMERGAESPDYRQLLLDVEAHCLAGLIFVTYPFALQGTPVMDRPGIPVVAISRGPDSDGFKGIPMVCPDFVGLQAKCLDELAARKRRRVAILHDPIAILRNFTGQAASAGVEAPEHWRLPVSIYEPATVKALIRLLLDPAQRERPEGLILADDHFVEPVAEAIASMGDKAPRDLEIVAHANFPLTIPSPMPMRRIGFHANEMLERCLQCLQVQQSGQSVPDMQSVSAVREEDLPAKDRELVA